MDIKKYEKNLNNLTFIDYFNKLKLLALSSFEWCNLPNCINEKWIERYLFGYGECMFFKDEEKGFMISKCSDGGVLNYYDEPTKLRPIATNYNGNIKDYENNIDCVLICNNDERIPTVDTVTLYSYKLTELSRTIDINVTAMKTPILISCNEKQRNTLKQVYKQWSGNEPVIFGSKDLDLSGVSVLKTDAPIVFDKLQIEKHAVWNECMTFLGVNNANMDKRERLVDDEVQANNEQIEMFAETMLKSRQRACEEINKMFNLDISVKFRHAKKGDFKVIKEDKE